MRPYDFYTIPHHQPIPFQSCSISNETGRLHILVNFRFRGRTKFSSPCQDERLKYYPVGQYPISSHGFSFKPTFSVFDPRYVGDQLLPVLRQSVFKPLEIKIGTPAYPSRRQSAIMAKAGEHNK